MADQLQSLRSAFPVDMAFVAISQSLRSAHAAAFFFLSSTCSMLSSGISL